MNKQTLLLSLSLLLFFSQGSFAQRAFYVDAGKSTNGDGTFANPWNNLLSGIFGSTQTDTSDVILYFRQGNYHITSDSVIFLGTNKSGLNGHYFILSSYPGEQATFDASGLTTDWSYIASISGSNIRLQNLQFANLRNITAFGVYISGTGSNIELRNCTFSNMLWLTDTAEAKFPTGSDRSIWPVYVSGSSSLPANVLIDTCHFNTIAVGNTGALVGVDGTPGAVIQTANTTSDIIYKAARYQFYVSPSGNDTTGTGSKANPWRTINYAVNGAGYDWTTGSPVLLDSNITIYLRGGTYHLANSIYIGHTRGQNGKWTTITNYPSEYVQVSGNTLTQKYASIFVIDSASYININGLDITNLTNDSTLTTVVGGVTLKDVRYGIVVEGTASHIQIVNNELHNMKWTRDTTKAKNPQPNDVLSAITVLGNTNTAITNLLIDNNTIHDIVSGYAEGMAINGNVDTFTISGNEVYDIANIGIVAAGNYQWVLQSYPSLLKANNQSRNGMIRDNSVYRCISPVATSSGIYLDGSLNITVKENESYNNGTGISVGNEQDSSTSGGHLIIGNNVWANLGPGMYLGSNNPTSTCSNVVVKYNADSNNYTINPTLYQRANGHYGTLTPSGRWAEIIMQRIQNLTFDENEVWSLSNTMLAFTFAQSNLHFTYNEYYTQDNNPCTAYFPRDTDGNGSTETIDTTFNQYAKETGLDTTSYLGGVAYNRHGCGTTGASARTAALTSSVASMDAADKNIRVFPDPVVNRLSVYVTLETTGKVRLELWDLSGKPVLRKDAVAGPGTTELGWDDIRRGNIASGVYILRVTGASVNYTRKIVVL
ncbi:MAG TPA: T9SS type A sorting domain-containing protein [Puia sp.]|nr:T9SS type A sorting domain-containing protein [Puia sp.]